MSEKEQLIEEKPIEDDSLPEKYGPGEDSMVGEGEERSTPENDAATASGTNGKEVSSHSMASYH